MPAVIIGRSDKLGWGMTSSNMDNQDILIEKVNPDDPSQYLGTNGWEPFKQRQTIITIKDHAPRTVDLKWTSNGPVLPDGTWDLDKITPPGHVPALSWTALSAQDANPFGLFAVDAIANRRHGNYSRERRHRALYQYHFGGHEFGWYGNVWRDTKARRAPSKRRAHTCAGPGLPKTDGKGRWPFPPTQFSRHQKAVLSGIPTISWSNAPSRFIFPIAGAIHSVCSAGRN